MADIDTTARGLMPPIAGKKPTTFNEHGLTRIDDYAWLRADNWQEVMRDPDVLDPDIRTYLEAENAFMQSAMKDTEELQKKLFEEMKGRIKEDDSTVPSPDGEWSYYVSYVTGGQHPLCCRRPRNDLDAAKQKIIIDGNALAEGHAYYKLGGVSHSPDHKIVSYGFDDKGSEYYTVKFRDIESGTELPDILSDTGGGAVWSKNGEDVYYTKLDDNHRPKWVFRHKMGTSQDDDILIYEEPDAGFFVGVGQTQSQRFITINIHDHQTSEIHLIDTEKPGAGLILVSPRTTGHEYDVEHQEDRFIILTNKDGAEDFKIMEAPLDSPGEDHWREILPHESGRLILDVTAYKNHLVRLERKNGLPRIVIDRVSDGETHEIAFDEEAYSLGLSGGYEYDTNELRFTYSSMTTPAQVFDYHMDTRERTLRKTQEVPSGHNPDDYVTRRLMAPAHDGETVPVTLLHRKDTPLDGSAPLLLYGYGAYGISIPASFSTNCLSLVDRGFVYAIAHIRGGKDKGYRWYKQGRLNEKINTFKDFISAGEFLVSQGYTRRGSIVAHGGSAGGMLMGAVANMAPDLFSGIIAEVPFVDVLNTILDETLPLTPPEWPEWGNPIESREAYDWIAAYSPYDNVEAKAYPAIIAVGGLTDPRVTYWEPAKWVAKLRELKTDDNPLLLKTNMEAGHGGASGRFDRLKEVALVYAFALKVVGKTELTQAIS